MKVFLSYARKDRDGLAECQEVLAPFAQDGRIELWVDREAIEPGESWRATIDEGLERSDVAVLLVSRAFMASDFIKKVELPALLAALHDRDRVIPVFLQRADCRLHPIAFKDRNGNRTSLTLDKLQGIGTPDAPLNSLDAHARDQAWSALAARVDTLCRDDVSRQRAVTRAASVAEHRAPLLDVYLGQDGGRLTREYRLGSTRLQQPAAQWPALEERFASLRDWMARPDAEALHVHREAWGALLFECLFGTPGQQGKLFARLNGNRLGADRPSYTPYRVRIHAPGELMDLPWQLCDWQGQLRARGDGWLFFLGGEGAPRPVTLQLPFRTLILGATPAALDTPLVSRLRGTLERQFAFDAGDPARWIASASTADAGWRERLADPELALVTFFDPGTDGGAGLRALRDALPADAGRLRLLSLVLEPSARASMEAFAPRAELLSIEQVPDEDPEVLRTAEWLEHWLSDHPQPLRAWNDIVVGELRGEPQAASLRLHANQTDWKLLSGSMASLEDPLWRIFDRYSLKRDLEAELNRHSRLRGAVRVLALCPFGAAEDWVGRFDDQLRHYVATQAFPELPIVARRNLGLPPHAGDDPVAGLREHLLTQLPGADRSRDLRDYLAELVTPAIREKGRQEGRRPVVWLYWGAFGRPPLHPRLTLGRVREWLQFCSGALANEVPDDVLLISLLALEVKDAADLPKVDAALHKLALDPANSSDHFLLQDPKPLERISESHVYELLREHPTLFRGTPEQRQQLAFAVVERSRGHFSESVKLLDYGLAHGWDKLLARAPARPAASDDDVEI